MGGELNAPGGSGANDPPRTPDALIGVSLPHNGRFHA